MSNVSNLSHSLRDSIEKELLKIENKQYTKTLKNETDKAIKQVLHNCLKPEKFKVNVNPLKDSKMCIEIEFDETQEDNKENRETTK